MSAMPTIVITDDSFITDVLNAQKPVLIDFWAPWCGPCRMLAPILDEIAEEFSGRLVVGKLDIEEHPAVPARCGVRGIPSLMLFKDGVVLASKSGMVQKVVLKTWIEQCL
jgi:thioredoxin 1